MLKIFKTMVVGGKREYLCVDAIRLIRGEYNSGACPKERIKNAEEVSVEELYEKSNMVRFWLIARTPMGGYKSISKGIARVSKEQFEKILTTIVDRGEWIIIINGKVKNKCVWEVSTIKEEIYKEVVKILKEGRKC